MCALHAPGGASIGACGVRGQNSVCPGALLAVPVPASVSHEPEVALTGEQEHSEEPPAPDDGPAGLLMFPAFTSLT